MGVLLPENAKVIVQGITGREGVARTKLMQGYGTNIVGGCTPGRGGEEVEGLPVLTPSSSARVSSVRSTRAACSSRRPSSKTRSSRPSTAVSSWP